MGKKVVVIHTGFVTVDALKNLFKEIMPGVEMINIVDDSLLKEVMSEGCATPGIIRRLNSYAQQAEALGADAILNQCSAMGDAVDIVGKMVNIPYIKVDEAMAEEAVNIGGRISVVTTVAASIGPSTRLVESVAERMGKKVEVRGCLVYDAFEVLAKEGNKEKHDKMIIAEIERAATDSDVIVLAQGSMYTLLPHLGHIGIPVLTSLRSGVERVKYILKQGQFSANSFKVNI